MALQILDMEVGQQVAFLAKYNNDYQVYTVSKKTKNKIKFERNSDKHEVSFSLLTNKRLDVPWNEWATRFSSLEEAQELREKEQKSIQTKQIWIQVAEESAKRYPDLSVVKELIAKLETLGV